MIYNDDLFRIYLWGPRSSQHTCPTRKHKHRTNMNKKWLQQLGNRAGCSFDLHTLEMLSIKTSKIRRNAGSSAESGRPCSTSSHKAWTTKWWRWLNKFSSSAWRKGQNAMFFPMAVRQDLLIDSLRFWKDFSRWTPSTQNQPSPWAPRIPPSFGRCQRPGCLAPVATPTLSWSTWQHRWHQRFCGMRGTEVRGIPGCGDKDLARRRHRSWNLVPNKLTAKNF